MKPMRFPSAEYATKEAGVTHSLRAVIAALAAIVALAGCGSSAQLSQSAASPIPTGVSAANATAPVARPTISLPPYKPAIDLSAFTDKITNPLFPLTPGMTYVYEGTRDGVPNHTEVTVTKETKTIMGVVCVVVRDVLTSNNALVEKTTDWYAQDKSGNVWYFGEDTAEYENGKVTSTAGSWLAGVDGALPGIVMKATPTVGEGYRQEYRPGEAEDYAKILKVDASHEVPAGSYSHVVVTEDTDLLDATKLEQKFYAPGAGYLGSTGSVNGHKEESKLSAIQK
jgi:hypothetical protein